MYVCICNQVSDREIRDAVRIGVVEFSELQDALGVGTCCGKCVDCAKEVLAECRPVECTASVT